MEFNRDAKIDTSQIRDVRGSRGGGGGGFGGGFGGRGGGLPIPLPRGAGGNMGCLGVVGLVIFLVLQFVNIGGGSSDGGGSSQGSGGIDTSNVDAGDSGDNIASCATDPNAVERDDCRLALVVNSVQAFWSGYLPENTPQAIEYRPAITQLYTQGTNTGCGQASSAVGPFYCPSDETVYIDMSFFDTMLTQLGAQDVPFVQAYVVAHEYGHHIQNILGILEQGQSMGQQGPDSGAVRIELMADCLAGVWANHATGTTDQSGVQIITEITDEDIQSGLQAAQAIGDDNIQSQSGGPVNPESFTHGTSEQRYNWFKTGIDTGDMAQCDTFSGNI